MVDKKDTIESEAKQKPNAAVFVDYENWFVTMKKQYHFRPNFSGWCALLRKFYIIQEIRVYGDFNRVELAQEQQNIEEAGGLIINTHASGEKDFSDFILLDDLYQSAINKNSADVYILYSGDGHFHRCVQFLRDSLHKSMGVFYVDHELSRQLRSAASWVRSFPNPNENNTYYYMVIKNFDFVEHRSNKPLRPTIKTTIWTISKFYNVPKSDIEIVLREMLTKGYLKQKVVCVNGDSVTTLYADWDLLKTDGYWPIQYIEL